MDRAPVEPVREVFAHILAGQGGTGAAAAASSVRLSVRELLLSLGQQIQRALMRWEICGM